VAITSSGLGLTDVFQKRNLDIVQQDRDGTTLRRWSLSRAWPVKFVASDWDNEVGENVIESVTLTYDFFEGAVTRFGAVSQRSRVTTSPMRHCRYAIDDPLRDIGLTFRVCHADRLDDHPRRTWERVVVRANERIDDEFSVSAPVVVQIFEALRLVDPCLTRRWFLKGDPVEPPSPRVTLTVVNPLDVDDHCQSSKTTTPRLAERKRYAASRYVLRFEMATHRREALAVF
jgi:hypothetical protein